MYKKLVELQFVLKVFIEGKQKSNISKGHNSVTNLQNMRIST